MRNKLHLSLWGALFVGACSSGGPGNYTSLSYTREAPGDTFESPGTVLSGNESAGSKTGQGSSADPPATSRDGGSITIKEAGTPIEASVIIEAGGPVPEGGSATACEDLQTCCDSLTGSTKTTCQSVVDTGQASSCAAALTSLSSQCG